MKFSFLRFSQKSQKLRYDTLAKTLDFILCFMQVTHALNEMYKLISFFGLMLDTTST